MSLFKIIVLTLLSKFIKLIYVIIPILEEYHCIINNDCTFFGYANKIIYEW